MLSAAGRLGSSAWAAPAEHTISTTPTQPQPLATAEPAKRQTDGVSVAEVSDYVGGNYTGDLSRPPHADGNPKKEMTCAALTVIAGAAWLFSAAALAEVKLNVADFGARPDSRADATEAIQRALAAAKGKTTERVVLQFPKGQYDVFPEKATRVDYFIPGTTAEAESPSKTKVIGLYLKGLKNLTLEGNGALLMYHGKMTSMVLDECENIEIRNFHLDYERPTVSELRVENVGETWLDAKIHPDSKYEILAGRLIWVGENWRNQSRESQAYDPARDVTWRTWNPVASARSAEELKPGWVRLHYDRRPEAKPGLVFQMRDGIRDQVGVYQVNCREVTWRNTGMHYAHGLMFSSHRCQNVSFERVACEPRPESGRTCASFADFMQFNQCFGKVRIESCRFSGAQDDAIGQAGDYLQIVRRPAPDQLVVRFMHAQSYGVNFYSPGDEIEFVHARTLTSFATNRVKAAELLNPREIQVTLLKPAPADIGPEDCVANVTLQPEIEIRNCRFARVPTRGMLIHTRRRVVIENNLFWRTPMAAILVNDDAREWFIAGSLRDMLIRGNEFVECGEPAIMVLPQNPDAREDNPVHRNIRIEGNLFRLLGATGALQAKSTEDLRFTGNRLLVKEPVPIKELLRLEACRKVVVADNIVEAVGAVAR